ncbi:FAS1 domain-containing protein [Rhizopus microsporus var. microsporus]|uniref:FAS1 domain-containing protein n=1 Tax=Rhizopus microsporus var. microsporus TaxID=86635 RepID=A0A1X0QVB0_RHIZD|nr:FAS1 domain-containing protein [Rhizopus microsporus var. microsporus]
MSQYFTSPYIMNFNMTDVIYYHIVNESILIQDLFSNDTMGNATVVNSLVSNDTINRLGYGVQLLLQKIEANQTNGTETSGNQTNGTETSGNQTNSTETSGDQSPTLVTDGSSNNNTGSNYTIGNGFGYATINTTQMVQTSNGIIYIIDKVLVPPVDFNLTLEALPNITQFSNLTTEQFNVTQFEQLFTTLNATNSSAFETLANMTNATYFVPVDNAFATTGQSQVDNQTLPNLLAAHIVQGVYYTTNITNATEDITAQSLAGQSITLSKNDTSFFVNNATIVVPNILLDSGVVHLIDTVLNYTSGTGNNTTGSNNGTVVPPPPPPGGSGASSSAATPTSNTMSSASSGPTSSGSETSAAATSSSTGGSTPSGASSTTSASTGSGTGNAFPTPSTGPSSEASMNAPAMYLAAVFAVVAYVF